jgi:citrate lyase subunit beta/citryl-CoA lyase
MRMQIPRSYLFVPGNRPERYAKACASGADAVIIDLEDAVPPAEKASARAALSAWLSAASPVLVRINAAETEWFRDDLALCSRSGVAGIILPKAARLSDIQHLVEHANVDTAVLPLIESAQGFSDALALARAPQVQRLIFGSLDIQLDLGMSAEEEELLYFRTHLALVSRLAGIESPVDGVTTAIDDPNRLREDTLRAKRLGFGGKLCIHPRQVALVNECFAPTAEEIAWATRVVEAAAAARGAAISLDGKMVDRPVIARAEAVLRHQANQSKNAEMKNS